MSLCYVFAALSLAWCMYRQSILIIFRQMWYMSVTYVCTFFILLCWSTVHFELCAVWFLWQDLGVPTVRWTLMTAFRQVVRTTKCVLMAWIAMTVAVARVLQVMTVPQVLTSVKTTPVRTMPHVPIFMATTRASVRLASVVSHLLGLSCP